MEKRGVSDIPGTEELFAKAHSGDISLVAFMDTLNEYGVDNFKKPFYAAKAFGMSYSEVKQAIGSYDDAFIEDTLAALDELEAENKVEALEPTRV